MTGFLKAYARALDVLGAVEKAFGQPLAAVEERWKKWMVGRGEVDDQIKRDEVFEVVMNAFASVADPHTNYFSPVNTEENRIQMSLSYEGIGASVNMEDGLLTVVSPLVGSPAEAAGLRSGDKILAIDGVRVRADGLTARLAQYRPGDKVALLVARRDRVMTLDVTLGNTPSAQWQLEVAPNATPEQRARFAAWLK